MGDERPTPGRRTILMPLAFAATGIGVALALWPFVAALGPSADVRARRVVFSLADLQQNAPSLVNVRDRPVLVFRRTPAELAALRDPPQTRIPSELRSTGATRTKNWHRSLRPHIAVLRANCTGCACIVRRADVIEPELFCPCCGSRYDLAGRIVSGLASRDLDVPPYEYIGDTTIDFPEYQQPS